MTFSDLTPVTWDALWSIEGLVALGTLFLACVTAVLAGFTSVMASKTAKLAKYTEREVALAVTAIEADVRPVLLGVPTKRFFNDRMERVYVPGSSDDLRDFHDLATVFAEDLADGCLFVSVPFRNEGEGIAFPLLTSLFFNDPGISPAGGEIKPTSLPRHEIMRTSFRIKSIHGVPSAADLTGPGVFTVAVDYGDLAGNIWSSEMNLNLGAGQWEPGEVKLDHRGRMKGVAGGLTFENN
jgi:hypothetical protein